MSNLICRDPVSHHKGMHIHTARTISYRTCLTQCLQYPEVTIKPPRSSTLTHTDRTRDYSMLAVPECSTISTHLTFALRVQTGLT